MTNVVEMPRTMRARPYVEVDGGRWAATELILNDPPSYRRLVATQVVELLALHRHYELPELDGIKEMLTELRAAYSDAEPFKRPLLAALADRDPDD